MTDSRIRLVSKVGGGAELRVSADAAAELGQAGMVSYLTGLGISPLQVGAPTFQKTRGLWIIPISKKDD
ncbi:hypothetical protein [Herbiconiux sp. YIM B11900]|uniref:hypothetical protein n=1 Tax=Herbiconiux sp. YIM B11900 TaxID=3404131 RepID=UPI003F826124